MTEGIADNDTAVLEGFAVIDKPTGITSHQFLASLKRRFGSASKIGHAGTLDGFASGVLIVLFGRYTRLSDYFMCASKGYEALVRFGSETDTLDPGGRVIATAPLPAKDSVEAVLPSFRGPILQAPPAYSAVHINGERAYELAMKGHAVEPEKRPVTIHDLELLSFEDGHARLRIACSKGTYIRSLARDIALAAGSRAHLIELRRTFSGPFSVEQAHTPEHFQPQDLCRLDMEGAKGLGLPVATLYGSDAHYFALGLPLHRIPAFADMPKAPELVLFGENGTLLGIARWDGRRWSYALAFEGSA